MDTFFQNQGKMDSKRSPAFSLSRISFTCGIILNLFVFLPEEIFCDFFFYINATASPKLTLGDCVTDSQIYIE